MYDFYLPTISAVMLFILSLTSIVVSQIATQPSPTIHLPYYKKSGGKDNRKPIKYSPNITNTFWHPVLFMISVSIFMYSLGINRQINASQVDTAYKSLSYIIFGGTFSLITGFILMLNYIELACSLWEFTILMDTLLLWSVTHGILNVNIHKIGMRAYILLMVALIITLNVLMILLTNKFYYYVK